MCALFAVYGGECPGVPAESRPEEHYLMHDGAGLWTGYMEPLELAVRDRELPVVG